MFWVNGSFKNLIDMRVNLTLVLNILNQFVQKDLVIHFTVLSFISYNSLSVSLPLTLSLAVRLNYNVLNNIPRSLTTRAHILSVQGEVHIVTEENAVLYY